VPAGAWHHVAVVSNGTDLRAYLDGAPLGSPQAALTSGFTGAFQVGAWTNAGTPVDWFSGTMDEVRVYDVALTQTQVQTAMASPTHVDTDSDGVADIYETGTGVYVSATNTGTNPTSADTDGDGFSDALEISDGTNPNSAASNTPKADVYVRIGATGVQQGTIDYPVATLGAAMPMLQNGGIIHFLNSANTNERPRITKPMRVRAEGGVVRVGTP
jgi:hypothetical protein